MKRSKTANSISSRKIYGIKAGRKTGVFELTPAELDALVTGFKGAEYKRFDGKEDAELFVYESRKVIDSQGRLCSCCGSVINLDNKIVNPRDAELLLQIREISVIVYIDGSFFFEDAQARSCGLGVFFGAESLENEGAPLHTVTNIGPRSITRAEIAAAIRALQIMSRFSSCPITIRSDCMTLVSAINNGLVYQWLNNGWKNPKGSKVENWDLYETLLLLIKKRKNSITFEHVLAHKDDQGNKMADWLAKQGAKADVGYTYLSPS